MEIGSSPSTFRFQPAVQPLIRTSTTFSTCCRRNRRVFAQGFSVSYRKFVDFALEETRRHTHLIPSPLQEKFSSINSKDGKGVLHMVSFQAAKIRLLRSLTIETETMQVLDFAVFPKVEYDLPIFCANFFTSGRSSIVVFFYDEEGSLQASPFNFFSPIVLWTKFPSSPENYDILYSAFQDYSKASLELIGKAVEETDASQISCNREAQYRYLT